MLTEEFGEYYLFSDKMKKSFIRLDGGDPNRGKAPLFVPTCMIYQAFRYAPGKSLGQA